MSKQSFGTTRRWVMTALVTTAAGLAAIPSVARAADKEVPLTFSGGHALSKEDFGRPINLMAAGLGVKPEQFREAFSGVTPARGRGPTRDEERKNKAALMKVLAPLGVTNERMDEVANYYRFRPQNGEFWPTKPAKGYAVVADGKITKLVVTDPGSGYNTPPDVTIPGVDGVRVRATLSFGKDLAKNGGVTAVERVDGTAK
jgi:hypothetical protein